MTRGNEDTRKASFPHWRDIRAMCGFTAKALEIQAMAPQPELILARAPDDFGPWITEALWFIATQKDILDLYQTHGARCAEMYARAAALNASRGYTAVLQKACTHFAQPEGVSTPTIQIEWFALSCFGWAKPDPERVERAVRAQHKWRFLDASRMQGGLLRDGVREAFEAIWMAGEYRAAYDYIDTLTLNQDMLQRED